MTISFFTLMLWEEIYVCLVILVQTIWDFVHLEIWTAGLLACRHAFQLGIHEDRFIPFDRRACSIMKSFLLIEHDAAAHLIRPSRHEILRDHIEVNISIASDTHGLIQNGNICVWFRSRTLEFLLLLFGRVSLIKLLLVLISLLILSCLIVRDRWRNWCHGCHRHGSLLLAKLNRIAHGILVEPLLLISEGLGDLHSSRHGILGHALIFGLSIWELSLRNGSSLSALGQDRRDRLRVLIYATIYLMKPDVLVHFVHVLIFA